MRESDQRAPTRREFKLMSKTRKPPERRWEEPRGEISGGDADRAIGYFVAGLIVMVIAGIAWLCGAKF